jgi:hypothetical protein
MPLSLRDTPLPRSPVLTSELVQRVANHMWAADRALHAAIGELQEAGMGAETHELQFRLAALMSAGYQGVTKRLYEHYPELCPAGLRGTLDQDSDGGM